MSTSPPPPPARMYRVHVTDSAEIVERGEKLRVWYVALNQGWLKACEHPQAETAATSADKGDESCPPGTVWQRQVELLLPAGSLLFVRTTRPHPLSGEPLDFLVRGQLRPRRHSTESYFRVVANYRLESCPADPKWAPPPTQGKRSS